MSQFLSVQKMAFARLLSSNIFFSSSLTKSEINRISYNIIPHSDMQEQKTYTTVTKKSGNLLIKAFFIRHVGYYLIQKCYSTVNVKPEKKWIVTTNELSALPHECNVKFSKKVCLLKIPTLPYGTLHIPLF